MTGRGTLTGAGARSRLIVVAILALVLGAACQPQGRVEPLAAASPVSPLTIGIRLINASQPELALDAFNRSISEEGVSAEALVGVAVANIKLGRKGAARTFLESAIRLDPNSPVARNNLGVLLYDDGEYVAALSEFQTAFALTNGADNQVAFNIGIAEFAAVNFVEQETLDEADYDVIQYGHGVFYLEPVQARVSPEPPNETGLPEAAVQDETAETTEQITAALTQPEEPPQD